MVRLVLTFIVRFIKTEEAPVFALSSTSHNPFLYFFRKCLLWAPWQLIDHQRHCHIVRQMLEPAELASNIQNSGMHQEPDFRTTKGVMMELMANT